MREQLVPLAGQRLTVTATVIRRSRMITWLNTRVETILLGPIVTLDNRCIADHVWFVVGQRLAAARLVAGDVVRFDARVRPYKKNCTRRPGQPFTFTLDYHLAYPSNVQRVAPCSVQIDERTVS